jgi:hypothetical protein
MENAHKTYYKRRRITIKNNLKNRDDDIDDDIDIIKDSGFSGDFNQIIQIEIDISMPPQSEDPRVNDTAKRTSLTTECLVS